jgi:hypothetical protein
VPITRPPTFNWIRFAKTTSKSRSVLAFSTWSFSPRLRAAACASSIEILVRIELVGLISNAMEFVPGTTSCSSSTRLATNPTFNVVTPVRLPPGRFRPETSPSSIGSLPTQKMIGIVEVAAFAASVAGVLPGVAITFTRRRTRSAASAGNRSLWPSAQRYSIATFLPSTYPVSLRPWWNAGIRLAQRLRDSLPSSPIIGIDGFACAATGQTTAAPPKIVMNSRRCMSDPKRRRRHLIASRRVLR